MKLWQKWSFAVEELISEQQTPVQMQVYRFRHCEARVYLEANYTTTIFPDGTEVPATPTGEAVQQATAYRLGYGADVAAMCREHELLHTWLAERFDLPHSPTLWAVAHDQDHANDCIPIWAQYKEEALVMAFQAYLNNHAPTSDLNPLVEFGHDLEQLKYEAAQWLGRAS